jgi:hypothetical protein
MDCMRKSDLQPFILFGSCDAGDGEENERAAAFAVPQGLTRLRKNSECVATKGKTVPQGLKASLILLRLWHG